ncbi:MAG: hypothetical protein QXK94_10705 [Candidatus Jordarchaeales archaeon]
MAGERIISDAEDPLLVEGSQNYFHFNPFIAVEMVSAMTASPFL